MTHTVKCATDKGFCVADQDMHPRKLFFRIMGFHCFSTVLKMRSKYGICGIIIRVNNGPFPDCRLCDSLNGRSVKRFHHRHFRISRGNTPILNGNNHLRFVVRSATALPGRRTSEKCFIHFYPLIQHVSYIPFRHSAPDFVYHQPCGDTIHGQHMFQSLRGTPPFVRSHQINSPKPLSEWHMGAMEKSMGGHRGLMMTCLALEQLPLPMKICFMMPAFRTFKSVWPSKTPEVLETMHFGPKPFLKPEKTILGMLSRVYTPALE